MPTVTYRPAEVLHWFGVGARAAKGRARKKGQDALQGGDFAKGLMQVAGAAVEFGKSTLTDIVQRQAEETTYVLGDDGFEIITLTSRKRVAYEDVVEVVAIHGDRYELTLKTGKAVLKPIAHLVAGRLKVPVGWLRNGMEVPYAMLIEELAARCGVEIVPE